jgi:hypothetical protein
MRQTPLRRKEGNGKKTQTARLALRNARRAQIARKGVPYKFKSNGKKQEARPVEASGTRTARLALRNARRAQIARKGVPYKFKSNGKKQEARLALRNARRAQTARKGVPYKFKSNCKSARLAAASESAASNATTKPKAGPSPCQRRPSQGDNPYLLFHFRVCKHKL